MMTKKKSINLPSANSSMCLIFELYIAMFLYYKMWNEYIPYANFILSSNRKLLKAYVNMMENRMLIAITMYHNCKKWHQLGNNPGILPI